MGIATQLFRLSQSTGDTGCVHYLLARAGWPSYPQHDVGAEDAADAFATSALDHLTGWWVRWRLPVDCRSAHSHRALWETSHIAFDEDLVEDPDLWAGPGLRRVAVWIATSDHMGLVVLGAAGDEYAFWVGVVANDELEAGSLQRPAQLASVYLLTDVDGSGELRDS